MNYLTRKWGLWTKEFREKASEASYKRDYERWLALALLSEGKSKDDVAEILSRHYNTINNWVNLYNDNGPEGLPYKPPPGQKPRLLPHQAVALREAMLRPPAESGLEGACWTYKQVIEFCSRNFDLRFTERTAQVYMHRLGFVRKRPRARYGKASNEEKKDL